VKIGAEDKKKVIAMAVLLVVAIPLAIHSFNFSNPETPATTNLPASTTAANSSPAQKKGPKIREGNSLDPTLNIPLLVAGQKIEYTGGSRNIFKVAEAPAPPIPKANESVRINQPPPVFQPPPPPPIPLVFYGFSNRPGEPRKAFLKEGDNIFVAVEGEVVERRYKIVKITNNFILVQDILNNNQQTINLTLPQATG